LFRRDHHLRIASVLQALDADQSRAAHCLFGGGTAIVLLHGESRESVDIDLLVSNREGYRRLRERLTTARGLAPLARKAMRPRSRGHQASGELRPMG
jgi:hypothetical protein